DGVTRYRLTAARQRRQQVADTPDVHVAAPAGLLPAPGNQLQLHGVPVRPGQLVGDGDHVIEPYVPRTQCGAQVLVAADAQAFNQLRIVGTGQRHASQFAFEHDLAGLHVLLAGLLLEPVLHLGPGPGGVDVAQVGVEPVAARPAGTPGDDLHLL